MADPLLQVNALTKTYGNLKVLDNITFELQRGEILGLVGRRGAGKTTLLHLIGGARQPTEGTISLMGDPVQFASTMQARQVGVELVYQPSQIVDQLDVIQNIFLEIFYLLLISCF